MKHLSSFASARERATALRIARLKTQGLRLLTQIAALSAERIALDDARYADASRIAAAIDGAIATARRLKSERMEALGLYWGCLMRSALDNSPRAAQPDPVFDPLLHRMRCMIERAALSASDAEIRAALAHADTLRAALAAAERSALADDGAAQALAPFAFLWAAKPACGAASAAATNCPGISDSSPKLCRDKLSAAQRAARAAIGRTRSASRACAARAGREYRQGFKTAMPSDKSGKYRVTYHGAFDPVECHFVDLSVGYVGCPEPLITWRITPNRTDHLRHHTALDVSRYEARRYPAAARAADSPVDW